MRVTFGALRLALDLAPLPSSLDAVILFAPATLWDDLEEGQRAQLLQLAANWSASAKRDVTWRVGSGAALWWCGPMAYGGPLHRSLLKTVGAPRARKGGLFALDWRTGEERALSAPRAKSHGSPAGDDEDDASEAEQPGH